MYYHGKYLTGFLILLILFSIASARKFIDRKDHSKKLVSRTKALSHSKVISSTHLPSRKYIKSNITPVKPIDISPRSSISALKGLFINIAKIPKAIPVVTISTITPLCNTSNISFTWTQSTGSSYLATIVLQSLNAPSAVFNNVSVTDIGSANFNLTQFNTTISAGNYNLTVVNSNGAGVSNFIIYPNVLNVTLSSYNVSRTQNVVVNWKPFIHSSTVNVTVIRLLNNNTIPMSTNIVDSGTLIFNPANKNLVPGAYVVQVVNTIASGVSSTVQLTSPFFVFAKLQPANYSGISNMTIIWTPFDHYQSAVNLLFSNGTQNFINTTIPNTGIYTFNISTYGLIPDFYYANIISNLGSNRAPFIVYSIPGLNVTSPNASVSFTTATTSIYVQWSPSDINASPANITLTNLNSNQSIKTSVANRGFSTLNLGSVVLVPGSYQIVVDSPLGSSFSAPFVIMSTNNLVIYSPNVTTNASDIGLLPVQWGPTNPVGGNVSIFLYQTFNNSVAFGPISVTDNGNVTLNLGSPTYQKEALMLSSSEKKIYHDIYLIS